MITLTPTQIAQTFVQLRELIEVNGQPFVGQAKRLLYELQPEYKYLQDISAEDRQAIQDREIEFGQPIAQPSHYANEHVDMLNWVCEGKVEPKKSKLAELDTE